MTNEEINIAIAEACGWKDSEPIPNYCSDLNAMHDAENWIIANKSSLWLFQDYAQNLSKNSQTRGLDGYIHSTARERAEAFLRTIGKWKEEV
jgi:hypothetical protein